MKVTISDVARLAGVSTATVSHTINSTRYVSGETKEKVLAVEKADKDKFLKEIVPEWLQKAKANGRIVN